MRILYVFEHFHPYIGGAEELFLGLATSFAKQGHEVNVVTTLHSPALPRQEIFNGITIHRINCHNRFLFTILSLPKIIKLTKNADFIHTASYNAAVPAFFAGLICRKKVLITFHEVWGELWMKLPFKSRPLLFAYFCYEKLILKIPFEKYIAVSEFTNAALKNAGVTESKITIIHNGLDYTKYEGYKIHKPVNFTICYFGRLGISKGLEILLPAFSKFSAAHPGILLKLIIPTYPAGLYKKIISMIAKYNIEQHIILLHDLTKQELLNEITMASCIAIPSHSEGFCYTAAETTALGIPVISSGKGALKEVVGGKHIHLKSLTVDDMVNAMQQAYSGEWEYMTPIKFDLVTSTNQYMNLYREVTGIVN